MWYCGGKGTGFGGAMFDCQEITSFKLEMKVLTYMVGHIHTRIEQLAENETRRN